ncbi:MAG: hypothetical protein DRN78_02955, partial [Thermoproteota archaeon]
MKEVDISELKRVLEIYSRYSYCNPLKAILFYPTWSNYSLYEIADGFLTKVDPPPDIEEIVLFLWNPDEQPEESCLVFVDAETGEEKVYCSTALKEGVKEIAE